jgi:phosphoglycerate dehydrogenase-like enzyme
MVNDSLCVHAAVFSEEPLPPTSPLWGLSNVILSPHDSATCADNAGRVQSIFQENIARFIAGEELVNQIWPVAPSPVAKKAARL